MALTKCRECSYKISEEAKSCPSCGCHKPQPRKTSPFTWFVLGFIILVAYNMIAKSYKDSEEEAARAAAESTRVAKLTPEERSAEEMHRKEVEENRIKVAAMEVEVARRTAILDSARRACADFTKRSLHDPDSAEFENIHQYYAEQNHSMFLVQVKLRARNGFNALRMMTVNCRVLQTGDSWRLVSLKPL